MNDRFTDDASRTIELAKLEARRLNHLVGTEHLALGLIRMVAEGSTEAGVETLRRILQGVDETTLRKKALAAAPPQTQPEGSAEVRYTTGMEAVLRHATWRAADNGLNLVRTEHLLLGMLREEGRGQRGVLNDLGVTYLRVVRQLVLLGALRGPINPDDMHRTFRKHCYGERVIFPKDKASVVLGRIPELLPPGASLACNRLDEDMFYVRISEGLDAAEYVRRAIALGPIK